MANGTQIPSAEPVEFEGNETDHRRQGTDTGDAGLFGGAANISLEYGSGGNTPYEPTADDDGIYEGLSTTVMNGTSNPEEDFVSKNS